MVARDSCPHHLLRLVPKVNFQALCRFQATVLDLDIKTFLSILADRSSFLPIAPMLLALQEVPRRNIIKILENLSVGADYGLLVKEGPSCAAWRLAMHILSPRAKQNSESMDLMPR
jgi:hypothetical protein